MNKKYKLNEGEYKFILTEKLHYPKQLDDIKEEIFYVIYQNLINMVETNQNFIEIKYDMKNNNLFNYIIIQITTYENDTSILKNYTPSFYYCENELVNNKIYKPLLSLKIPINLTSHQGSNASAIRTILTHEIGHLYDDWISQSQGNKPFSLSQKNKEIFDLSNLSNNTNVPLLKSISHLAYLSNDTEKHSFISQVFNELKLLNCNRMNWREKYPQLTSYQNYSKLYIQLKTNINNTDINNLFYINNLILYTYKNLNIPTINVQNFDSFEYKKKILKYVEELYNDFIHRLGGIISYYLDEQSIVPNGLPQNQFS